MDLTRGNAAANLLKFALPFLLAYFMQVLYSAVDFMVVGHFCDGSAGVSAVANGSEVMNLIMSLILGLTTGATVLIGRYYGAKNMEKVNASIGMVLSLSTLIALGMTAVVVPCIPFIVHCLKTPPEAVRETASYAGICSLGIFFIFGYNALSAIFRGFGNSTAPLIFVGIACIINVIGDLLFVAVFNMGVPGTALATVLSQACSMFFALYYLRKGPVRYQFKRENFRIPWNLARDYIKIGIPIGIQGIMVSLSFLFIFTIVNSMGVSASAGYGICAKINGFAMLPAMAFSMALSATTAQNMGAGKPHRAIHTLWLGIGYTFSFGAVAL